MKKYIYTYLDCFHVLHNGNVVAESEMQAKESIEKTFNESIAAEIWKTCEVNEIVSNFHSLRLDRYYLQRSNDTNFVYSFRILYVIGRILCLFMLFVEMYFEKNWVWTSFFAIMFFLTFVESRTIIIYRDCIIYKKRFFLKKIEEASEKPHAHIDVF